MAGLVRAIATAHAQLQVARVSISQGRLEGANRNRSPTSYLANRPDLIAKYVADGDTEKTMTVVKVDSNHGSPLGAISFFSVHGTSMNNSNQLVNGDNKGYAAWLFEREINGGTNGPFVAAFGQV